MPGLFDVLGQPEEQETGLQGLALALERQGGQPRGLRQALGAGLLGASGTAQEVLPSIHQAIQQDPNVGAGGAFLSTLLPSMLAGVGGPARKRVSAEQEKTAFQKQILQEGFRFLSPESQEKVLSAVGLPGLKAKRDEDQDSVVTRALAQQFAQLLTDPEAMGSDREQAANALMQMDPDPNIQAMLQSLDFGDPEKNAKLPAAWLSSINQASTNESFLKYLETRNLNDLVPAKEGRGGGGDGTDSPTKQRDQLALNAYAKALERSQVSGRSVDEELTELTVGDQSLAANVAGFMHLAVGAQTPTQEQVTLNMINAAFSKDPLNFVPERAIPNAIKAGRLFMQQLNMPPTPARPRQPGGVPTRGMGVPQVGLSRNQQATLEAMIQMGVAGVDSTVATEQQLREIFESMSLEDKKRVAELKRSLVGQPGVR